ncbi:hypothetical protein ACIRF8_13705 [Streptomyces sp. NPDC102406]|uniref:hypothetical protein n=1 Tax=Streptomyces sp. NPDC102406 TaxID=3366171 RepID=UPI00381D3C5E
MAGRLLRWIPGGAPGAPHRIPGVMLGALRWIPGLVLGALWWWGVLRLALAPDAGALEGAVAAGGWGLSLLPVHALPKARATGVAGTSGRRGGARRTRAVEGEGDGGAGARGRWSFGMRGRIMQVWRRRRSGGA